MSQIQIKRSTRARSLRITIYPTGDCVVTAPVRMSEEAIQSFVHKKRDWIDAHLARCKKFEGKPVLKRSRGDYLKYKKDALNLARARISHYNAHYKFSFNHISIRNQKTRWGSCSKKGNLNFSYLLSLLAPHLADYIVVHELCHLQEFNHSKRFWDLVAETIPNHKQLRKELKDGHLLIS